AYALRAHHARERADEIVGFVLRIHEPRHAQVTAQLATAPHLRREIERRALAIRLVRRVDAAAVGGRASLIEGHRYVSGPHSLDQMAEKAREPEHRVHRVAVPVAHVRKYGVVGAKDVARSVDKEDHQWPTTASAECDRATGSSAGSAREGIPSGRRAPVGP